MRNARSKSTFRPRWRQRTSGKKGEQESLLKGVTSSASQATYDPEVAAWVSNVDSAGGTTSTTTIDALNTFLRTIKASSGLREKIVRLNLFCGSNLSASLVPLISDVGSVVDTNNNFTASEYTKTTGLTNSSASGNKYLDTTIDFADSGVSFTDGHIAVNTLGANTSSTYKEWIGRDHACIGSNLGSNKHHFRWGEHLISADNTNPQDGTSMGFYLGNASSTEVSLFLNDNKKITKTITSNSPSNAIDKNFHVFKRNTIYTGPNDFDRTVNFYSIGKNLTDAEAKVLYEAVTVFNQSQSRQIYDAQDIEAWRWANHRVQEVVGDVGTHFASNLTQIADSWMLDLKKYNFRDKIGRANLFLGKSSSDYAYLAALVPLIIDKGNRTDTNVNFINSDYNFLKGLKGNALNKYLDTGYSESVSHVSVVTSTESNNSIGPSNNALIGTSDYDANGDSSGTKKRSIGISTTKSLMEASVGTDSSQQYERLISDVSIDSSVGMFIANVDGSTAGAYYNGERKATFDGTVSPSPAGRFGITVFARSVTTGQNISTKKIESYTNQTIKQYTIGDDLTSQEVADLNTMNSGIARVELTATNTEVYEWANSTVPANGGDQLTQLEVDAVDAWMTKVKSVSGLQDKIKRANLMVGSDLASKSVPIISTLGEKTDSTAELYDTDVNVKGVKGGSSKYINTTVKLSEFLTDSSGHFSIQQSKNFNASSNGNAHGVFSTDSTKPKFGIEFDNDSIDAYVYNTSNAASLSNTTSSQESLTPAYLGSFISSGRYAKYHNNAQTLDYFQVVSTGNGEMTVSFNGYVSTGNPRPVLYYVYVNGILRPHDSVRIVPGTANINFGHSYVGGAVSFSTDVSEGDVVKVSMYGPDIGGRFEIKNLSAVGKYTFPSTEINGLWTASRTSSSSLALYQGAVSKATSSDAVSGSIVNRDDFVYVLGAYGEDGSTTKDFSGINSHLGFYSLGEGLTAEQVTGLSEAYETFQSTLRRSLDAEVWDWGYKRVVDNGGFVTDSEIDSINTFMTSLKATAGLRESIKRLNVFGGSDVASAMVPLIRDAGSDLETNYNFVNNDIDQGINSSANKYLDLGLSLGEIPNGSFQNFHLGVSTVVTSLPTTSTAYVLGDSSIKLDLNNSSARVDYASSAVTASSTGSDFWVASQESSAMNLYKGGTSLGSGSFDGSGSVTANSFILFGSRTESGIVNSFSGRLSLYSLGQKLTSAQVSAFNTAVDALETNLRRGIYKAETLEAWTWANNNVKTNGGTVTQSQVNAVDKFMKSVNGIPNLRSSIKRMNLFVGDDLEAALTPVVKDLGSTSDTNNNFVSADYTKDGLHAGLKGDGSTKSLDTTVKAGSVVKDSWHMSFRSPDGNTSSSGNQPLMGAERGLNIVRLSSKDMIPTLTMGIQDSQTVSFEKKAGYAANFKDPIREYNGCSINYGSILGSSVNSSISESNCENSNEGINSYTESLPEGNGSSDFDRSNNSKRIYDFKSFSTGSSSQFFGSNNVVQISEAESDKMKGLYSVLASKVGTTNTTKVRMFKDGYIIQETSLNNPYDAPTDDELALFGVKNNGVFHLANGTTTINFYCIGNGPEAASSTNNDTLDDNFLPQEMSGFLSQLDRDLNRGGFAVHSATPLITSTLDPEVKDWANNRVPRAGGKMGSPGDNLVQAADAFMKKIKETSGLRDKIYRLNLFLGDNLNASLVPLICDKGFPVDINKGSVKFIDSDYSSTTGLTANVTTGATINTLAEKYLDTGLKAGNNFSTSEGHMAFATSDTDYSNLNGHVVPLSLLDVPGGTAGNLALYLYKSGPGLDDWINPVWGKLNENAVSGQWRYVNYPDRTFSQNTLTLANAQYNGNSPVITFSQNGAYFRGKYYCTQQNLTSQVALPESSTLTLFAKVQGKDSTNFRQGGLMIPSKSSLTPVLLDDGKYYIFALTEKAYTLENLINPNSNQVTQNSQTVEGFIEDVYGKGWSSVTYSNISSLWATSASDGNLQMARLLQDLKHEHQYDKPIGWLDIENSGNIASSLLGYESRLLLHNNKSKGLNSFAFHATDSTSKTAVRNVQKNEQEKACPSCSQSMTSAPLLIKTEVSDPTASETNAYQSWGKSISFYSAGGSLSDAQQVALNSAYKTFATAIGRTVTT